MCWTKKVRCYKHYQHVLKLEGDERGCFAYGF
jgi:hypothetical protein